MMGCMYVAAAVFIFVLFFWYLTRSSSKPETSEERINFLVRAVRCEVG